MDGALMVDVTADEHALAAKLGPETLFGRTVADRRTWLFMLRTLAIVSGHPRSMAVVINDVDLIVEPQARLGRLIGWLEELLIVDPVAAGAAAKGLRERMAQHWGRWHGWDDEALTFAVLSIGDGVIFAAEKLKGGPLSESELAELHESVVAMMQLTGADTEPIAADHRAFRRHMDAQLLEKVDHRPLHEVVAARPVPAPRYIPTFIWTAGQIPGRHFVKVVLAATLPEVTKARFGMRQSTADRAEWAVISLAFEVFGRLPEQLRLVPAARRRRSS